MIVKIIKRIVVGALVISIPALCLAYSIWVLLHVVREHRIRIEGVEVIAYVDTKDSSYGYTKGISMPKFFLSLTYTKDGNLYTGRLRVDERIYSESNEEGTLAVKYIPKNPKIVVVPGNNVIREHVMRAVALDILLIIFSIVVYRIWRRNRSRVLKLSFRDTKDDVINYLASYDDGSCDRGYLEPSFYYLVADWRPIFSEIARILKPKSVLLLSAWIRSDMADMPNVVGNTDVKLEKFITDIENYLIQKFSEDGYDTRYGAVAHVQSLQEILPAIEQAGLRVVYAPVLQNLNDTNILENFVVLKVWK